MAAVEVLAREALGRSEGYPTFDGELVPECQCPLQPVGVEPQCGVFDAGLGLEAPDDGLGVRPARHQALIDERAYLDVLEPGLGQRLDQPDLVGCTYRPGLDLEALARPFLVDIGVCRQVGHFSLPFRWRGFGGAIRHLLNAIMSRAAEGSRRLAPALPRQGCCRPYRGYRKSARGRPRRSQRPRRSAKR